ncbi:hypothetical protein B0H14DRAFT_2578679 [Mycena olivaceomarginata]|nr:hypothetical protein B0H14DRAFT_2578679 [Mycena olivaceomarginata]
MANTFLTFDTVGRHHTDFCHEAVHLSTVRKTRLTLNLIALIHTEDGDEDKVYTPMDIDDPALYNAMNFEYSRVYTPMDVDGTVPLALDARSTKTYLDSQMKSPLLTSNQNNPIFLQHLECKTGNLSGPLPEAGPTQNKQRTNRHLFGGTLEAERLRISRSKRTDFGRDPRQNLQTGSKQEDNQENKL